MNDQTTTRNPHGRGLITKLSNVQSYVNIAISKLSNSANNIIALQHSVSVVLWVFSHVLLLLVHVLLIVFLHYGLYVDLSVPLTRLERTK